MGPGRRHDRGGNNGGARRVVEPSGISRKMLSNSGCSSVWSVGCVGGAETEESQQVVYGDGGVGIEEPTGISRMISSTNDRMVMLRCAQRMQRW